MNKANQLNKLEKEWVACERCPLFQLRKQVVFGGGNPEAKIVMIGEVPGEDVAIIIKIMNKLLNNVKISLDSLWITNVCLCRPVSLKKNRAPKLKEIKACHPRLMSELEIIKPEIIVLAGNTPLYMATGKRGITKQRGWQDIVWSGNTFSTNKIFATLHPSSLLHGSKEQKQMKADWIIKDWLEIGVILGKEKRQATKTG